MKEKVIVSSFLVVGLAILAIVAFVSVIGGIPEDSEPSQQVIKEELYFNKK